MAAGGRARKREAGDGGSAGQGSPESAARRLREHGDELRRGGAAMATSARGAAEELSRLTRAELERSPYLTVGATFALGFVLGGGVPPRLLVAVTALGARAAMASLMREVASGAKAGFAASGSSDS